MPNGITVNAAKYFYSIYKKSQLGLECSIKITYLYEM